MSARRRKPERRAELVVDRLSPKGDGLASLEQATVEVPRAVPGDHVEVVLGRKRRGHYQSRVLQLLQPGLPRREPPCSHFGHCGGCRWQDLNETHQLALKEGMVREALQAHEVDPGVWHDILGAASPLRYRNKMEFSFGADRAGKRFLGLHERGRFDRVFDLESCHLQHESGDRVVASVRRHAADLELSIYHLRHHEGLLRFLVVRRTEHHGQLMVNLVVSEYPRPDVDALVDRVLDDVPDITTFIVTLHTGRAQTARGQREFVRTGSGHMLEECNGLTFEVSPHAFLQPNTRQAEVLYRQVLAAAGPLDGVAALDLYCGIGSISMHLARSADRVIGIEEVADAVLDAKRNAKRNDLTNCQFVAGRVEDLLPGFAAAGARFALAVVDPPRAGLHDRALAALVGLAPTAIVYVSCNPQQLAVDLRALVEGGYRVEHIQPVDLFPQTPHCEVVARLTRPA
ncbi:MAG: 23S rRNA (uracil(1939)-C(5))-methyltransferase RlmD [Planctomycetota bacterium]